MEQLLENPNLDTETFIPGDEEITETGTKSWRPAKGKFVRGRKDALEEHPSGKIVGKVKRYGIIDAVSNDSFANRYVNFEIDVQTREGVVSLHAGLWDGEKDEFRPSGSAVSLAKACLLIAKNPTDTFMLKANKGADWMDEKTGKLREGTTYIDLYRVYQKDGKPFADRIAIPKRSGPPASYAEQWTELHAELKATSLYKDREGRGNRDAGATAKLTHLSELSKEVKAKGWPTPEEQPAAWSKLYAAASGQPSPATLAQWDDDIAGQMRQHLKDKEKLPRILADALAKPDPFA